MTTALVIKALLFGGIFGFLWGSGPFLAANSRGRIFLGLSALGACTIAGMIGGGLLSIPVSYLFKYFILSLPEKESATEVELLRESQRTRNGDSPMAPRSPYTILGTAVVCNRCNKACSKIADNPPSECPHCHRSFDNIPKVHPIRKNSTAVNDEELIPLVQA